MPLAVLTLAAALVAPPVAPLVADVRHHALVVANNRSLDAGRPDLHYADDDGVKYAELFADLFGREHVQLLTRLDAQTAALHPEWADATTPPTRAQLTRAVESLSKEVADERARGRRVELHLVFAGHGDVEGGAGYLELEDGRLGSHELDLDVLARLPADRVHLVLDSCNSFFLLNPRKPGGRRWAAGPDRARSLLAKHPHVGAVLSTSAEALTYEWSELQSGIFSYEVRSGLRGAADVDLDGRVTYRELAAFLRVANAGLVNDQYRPRVFHAGPGGDGDETLLTLPAEGPRRLYVAAEGVRRLTLRDARGVRLLDLHKAFGTAVNLWLPARGAVSVHELVPGPSGARPTMLVRAVPASGVVELDALVPETDEVAARGEAPVFQDLFRMPFGGEQLAETETPAAEEVFGLTRADAERLARHLSAAGEVEQGRRVLDSAATLAGAVVVASIMLQVAPPNDVALRNSALLGVGAAGAVSLAALLRPVEKPSALLTTYLRLDDGSARGLERAVLTTEASFETLALDAQELRRTWLWVGLGATVVELGLGLGLSMVNDSLAARLGTVLLVAAPATLVVALEQGLTMTSVERAWNLYRAEIGAADRLPVVAPGTSQVGLPGTSGLQLTGRF